MNTDTISDYLTRIRNAIMVRHKNVYIPYSKMKKNITEILFSEGYIKNFYFYKKNDIQKFINIELKYYRNKFSVIRCIKRVSKPGLRKYCKYYQIPRILNGLGIALISTSRGLMTDRYAKINHLGGEIVCLVY